MDSNKYSQFLIAIDPSDPDLHGHIESMKEMCSDYREVFDNVICMYCSCSMTTCDVIDGLIGLLPKGAKVLVAGIDDSQIQMNG